MQVETSPAIVLRTRDYAESDRIVTLLTQRAGKMTGIAKGAKRSKRRFAGTLELFSYVQLDYRHRRGAELVFCERSSLLRAWWRILDSIERIAAASHVVELADKMTLERETGEGLFHIVLATLARLDRAEPAPATLRLFELAALTACGYRPSFERCDRCRSALVQQGAVLPSDGAVVICRNCANREPGGLVLDASSLFALASLQAIVDGARGRDRGESSDREAELFADESSLDAILERASSKEIATATLALLRPHVRGRIQSLELFGPALQPGVQGGGGGSGSRRSPA